MTEEARAYRKLLMRAADAYARGDYDRYEELIERGSRQSGRPEWQVEDDVTDVRLLGIEGC